MDKVEKRRNLIPNPEYDEPCKFYHTIDAYSAPGQGYYKPKQMKAPIFEALGSKRRTDTSYVKMRTTKARDNAMYKISDNQNLDDLDKPSKFGEPERSVWLCEKFQESQSFWERNDLRMPSTAQSKARSSIMQNPDISTTGRQEASTASESTRKHVVRQNGLIKVLEKRFDTTAKQRLTNARNQFRSQTLEQRILDGTY